MHILPLQKASALSIKLSAAAAVPSILLALGVTRTLDLCTTGTRAVTLETMMMIMCSTEHCQGPNYLVWIHFLSKDLHWRRTTYCNLTNFSKDSLKHQIMEDSLGGALEGKGSQKRCDRTNLFLTYKVNAALYVIIWRTSPVYKIIPLALL